MSLVLPQSEVQLFQACNNHVQTYSDYNYFSSDNDTLSDWMITYLTLISLKVKEDNYRHLFSKKNKLLKNNI